MGRPWAALALVLVGGPAYADSNQQMAAADQLWPSTPKDRALPLEDVMVDHLSELGNTIGQHLELLSDHYFALHVDGRNERARMRLGGGNPHYLELRVDSDWKFDGASARIKARVDLAFHDHQLHLELPNIDMAYADYRGEQGVEVKLPLFERTW